MKIRNKTKYNTADLKKIFLASARKVRTGKYIRKKLIVDVVNYQRRASKATYSGGWALINIGTFEYDKKNIWKKNRRVLNVREIAWVACHEFLHSKGLSHRRINARYPYFGHWSDFNADEDRMAWADKFELRLKEVKIKPKKDLQMVRYQKVVAKVKEYTTKAKRVQNILSKYKAKQRRYEKVLVLAGKISQPKK